MDNINKDEIKKVVIDKLKYSVSNNIHLDCIQGIDDLKHYVDFVGKEMIIALSKRITGKDLKRQYIYYPQNSWQHFKKDFFPSFLLKLFPVEYKQVEIKSRINIPNYITDNFEDYYLTYTTERD